MMFGFISPCDELISNNCRNYNVKVTFLRSRNDGVMNTYEKPEAAKGFVEVFMQSQAEGFYLLIFCVLSLWGIDSGAQRANKPSTSFC